MSLKVFSNLVDSIVSYKPSQTVWLSKGEVSVVYPGLTGGRDMGPLLSLPGLRDTPGKPSSSLKVLGSPIEVGRAGQGRQHRYWVRGSGQPH